ncbi:uncharacterized protein V1510DRAFT_396232 [Dipodascopsis tothii]|uniref:uncharacterized protein n=1 Tax=Dipodascopsis tothii TaxID=44089 RepID=UPI0034CD07E0
MLWSRMRTKFRPKHQRLILQCYPGGRAQEKHPNSSELSYLLYYVSTRRSKLPKVGLFLDRKVKSDLWRGRAGNVQVSVDICKALVEKCPTDVNLFAEYVVSILTVVAGSNDLALCQYTGGLFKAFCAAHDGALLADDKDFVVAYVGMLGLYMDLPRQKAAQSNVAGWRLVALEAAKSVAASEALAASNGQLQIETIVPVILDALAGDHGDALGALNMRLARAANDPPPSAAGTAAGTDAGDAPDDADEPSVLALGALRTLYDTTNPGQVRLATRAVVQFMLRKPANDAWNTALVELLAEWTPVQFRFIILRTLLECLTDHVRPAHHANELTITKLVASLLSCSISLVGLSVLDVLHLLFSQIVAALHAGPRARGDVDTLVRQLSLTIGDLATHIYYSNQITDMVSEIILRLESYIAPAFADAKTGIKNNLTSLAVDAASLYEHDPRPDAAENSYVLSLAFNIIKEVLTVANSTHTGVDRNTVPAQVWFGTECVVFDSRAARSAYLDALFTFFCVEVADPARDSFTLPAQEKLAAAGSFVARVHAALYDFIVGDAATDGDLVAINFVLNIMAAKLGLGALLHGVPMAMKLQTLLRDGAVDLRHRAAVDSLCLLYLDAFAGQLELRRLKAATATEIAARKAHGAWAPSVVELPRPVPATRNVFNALIDAALAAPTAVGASSNGANGANGTNGAAWHPTYFDAKVVGQYLDDAEPGHSFGQLLFADSVKENAAVDVASRASSPSTNRLSEPKEYPSPLSANESPLVYHVANRAHVKSKRLTRAGW